MPSESVNLTASQSLDMGTYTPSSPGNFSYPPPGSHLQFNYIDSVVTSWLTFDPDATGCLLSVWYWPNTGPWLMGLNETAAANGTAIVPLDFADSSYLGQLNINYTGSDGSAQKFVGPFFNVDTSSRSGAKTWSQGVLSTPTSPASAGHKTANSAFPVTSSASSTTTTTSIQPSSLSSSSASNSLPDSNPLATNGSHLGAGAIAGIVVGIVIGAGIAAALILFHRRRKPENVQAEVKASSSADFQSPVPTRFVGEKDGSPIGPNELSGDGQLLEMATDNH